MKERRICSLNFNEFFLKTAPFKRNCRYHKKQGQEFSSEKMFPKNFCPHLYAQAYSFSLALLYNAKFNGKQIFDLVCPEKLVKLTLEAKYTLILPIRIFKKIILNFLQKLGIVKEFPDKRIILKITQSSNCPLKLVKGQSFLFNIWKRDELCPASFYTSYPLLMSGEKTSFHCPDPEGVSYVVGKDKLNCEKYFFPKDTMSSNLCPLAFYSILPYYITLINSGYFEWVKRDQFVEVQCPRPEGIIMTAKNIEQEGCKKVRVEIDKVIKDCPRLHKKGEIFDFDTEKQYFWLKDFMNLVPKFSQEK